MPVSIEDNLKLVLAYSIFDGDADKAAKYMGITKNAALVSTSRSIATMILILSRGIRFAKLIRDEKEKATKLGFLDGGEAPTKKRPASGGGRAAKKTKTKDNNETVSENGNDSHDK